MNKIKFLYDVVSTMRAQNEVTGTATAEVQKDQQKIFFVKNQFQKNFLTKQTKATITTEIDYDGKEVRHQSTTECLNHPHAAMHHHRGFGHMMHHGMGHRSLKTKLNKLAFALHLLNNVQIEEQENKTFLITLEVKELPDELKTFFKEQMEQAEHHHKRHHGFIKDFCSLGKGVLSFAMTVHEDYTIEKISVTFDGLQNKSQAESHEVNLIGNLQLAYSDKK